MSKIVIINGPNLNFLGKREISKYGVTTFQELVNELEEYTEKTNDLVFFQSNDRLYGLNLKTFFHYFHVSHFLKFGT